MEGELQYVASFDSKGRPFEGSKTYKFHLPPNIPASNFWSVIVYDKQTRLMIRTEQPWPSVFSTQKKMVYNQDGSIDTWFGPKVLPGKEHNWVMTIPGQGWNLILRLYYPLESWFDKSWRPWEVEEVE